MKGKNLREWQAKPNKGTKVPGTPCVPMKTPQMMEAWNLKKLVSTSPKVNKCLSYVAKKCISIRFESEGRIRSDARIMQPFKEKFAPSSINTLHHGQVKLLIDLTAKEYFTPAAVEKHGIQYKKIRANFGDRSPSTEAVDDFKETVNEFMRDDEEGDAEIAVICTYGTNRSGYLICRYLMDMLDMDPKEAIERFEEARGESFDPQKPVLKGQLLAGLNHCIEQEGRFSPGRH